MAGRIQTFQLHPWECPTKRTCGGGGADSQFWEQSASGYAGRGLQDGVLESVRPHEVRFTHDRISSCFRAGSHSDDVLEIAISGSRAARQVVRGFPPMELVRFPSK